LSLVTGAAAHVTDAHDTSLNHAGGAGLPAGITIRNRLGGTRFCPLSVVTREQMAAFLHRGEDYRP
jgi:hypothetical protein